MAIKVIAQRREVYKDTKKFGITSKNRRKRREFFRKCLEVCDFLFIFATE